MTEIATKMTLLKSRLTDTGVFYVPKEVRECFGRNMCWITDAKASILFPEEIAFEDVLTSMEVIKADIKHRISLRDRSNQKRGDTIGD